MIQKLVFSLTVLFPLLVFAKGAEYVPELQITRQTASKSVHADSTKLVFTILDAYGQLMLNQHPAIIQLKLDKKTKKHTVTESKNTFRATCLKGTHTFSFFINANFEEIHWSPDLKGGYLYEIELNFHGSSTNPRPIVVEKPVIYLYSETNEAFRIHINTEAEIQFTYPQYDSGWSGVAHPDGSVTIDQKNYPYLFWDAALTSEALHLTWENSELISGKNCIEYLTSKLDYLGFNPKEKTDFITYWGPRLQQLENAEITWFQDEEIDPLATLTVSPSFTQNRIYLVFREAKFQREEKLPQHMEHLKPLNRSGNYLLEWGGMELTQNL